MAHNLPGGYGIWNAGLRNSPESEALDAIKVAEQLGFTCVWFPDRGEPGLLDRVEALLGATSTIHVATGILNIWMHEPQDVATRYAQINRDHGDRFVLGLGASHQLVVEATGDKTYSKPYSAMVDYLDALEATDPPVGPRDRVLAALGPKMTALAAGRSAGVHNYFVPPEHTRDVRAAVGPASYVTSEIAVVLESDPEAARATARAGMGMYFHLPNYLNNLERYGFTSDDLVAPGSDRVIDALVAWGTDEQVAAKVHEMRDAGADHVSLQVLTGEATGDPTLPVDEWARLSRVLIGT